MSLPLLACKQMLFYFSFRSFKNIGERAIAERARKKIKNVFGKEVY